MLFNSIAFLFLFLPVVYLGFWKLKERNHRFVWLTLTGYVFTACGITNFARSWRFRLS